MTRFGVLLPHFGGTVSPQAMVDGAQMAEDLGFDSVWARDHLVYRRHAFEPGDESFLETFTTLAFVAGATRRLAVGTAVTIPTRHPVMLAQIAATLSNLAGPGRVWLGMGAGGDDREFDVVGLEGVRRVDVVRQHVEVLRRLWRGDPVRHDGSAPLDVSIRPTPAGEIPLLYGGSTPAAVRLAAELFDGWLPGRIPFATLERRLEELRPRFEQQGSRPVVGMVPLTSVAATREAAEAPLPVDRILANANGQRFWVRPSSGEFAKLGDLRGSVLVGTPDDVVHDAAACIDLGLDLIVFDLRMRFSSWVDQLGILATDVLPRLRPADVHDRSGAPG